MGKHYGGVAKPGSDFYGAGRQNIAGFTFLEFPRVEQRVGMGQHTQSAHRRLLKIFAGIAW